MGAAVPSPGTSGMLSKMGDMVGTVRGAGPKSAVHEVVHRGYQLAPGRIFREAERLNKAAPRSLTSRLTRDYGNAPIDEAAAWMSESKSIPRSFPMLNQIQREAWDMVPKRGFAEIAEKVAPAIPATRNLLDLLGFRD
jgi:hypothetical protein